VSLGSGVPVASAVSLGSGVSDGSAEVSAGSTLAAVECCVLVVAFVRRMLWLEPVAAAVPSAAAAARAAIAIVMRPMSMSLSSSHMAPRAGLMRSIPGSS
jgi:hypothetical protein